MPAEAAGDPELSQPQSGKRLPRTPVNPLDPTLLGRAEIRAALDARDIGTLYRLLWQAGVTQRRIAQLTGQAQSEVSEILKGRQVRDVKVLERIADGLGVPRGWMRLDYGEGRPATPSSEEVDEDVKRRALLAATATAAIGQAIPGTGRTDRVGPANRGAAALAVGRRAGRAAHRGRLVPL
jgi:transcriptional regulator with XRE-family HTH domain